METGVPISGRPASLPSFLPEEEGGNREKIVGTGKARDRSDCVIKTLAKEDTRWVGRPRAPARVVNGLRIYRKASSS